MSIITPKNGPGAQAPTSIRTKPLPIKRSRAAVWARRLAVSALLLGGCGERALLGQGGHENADASVTDTRSDAPVDCSSVKPLECSDSRVYEEYLAKGGALAVGQYLITLDTTLEENGEKVARVTLSDSCGKMLFIGGVRENQTIYVTSLPDHDMEITAQSVSVAGDGKAAGALMSVRSPCRDDAGVTHWCSLISDDLDIHGFLSIGTFSVIVDAAASDGAGNLYATVRVRALGGALLHECDIYPGGYSLFELNGVLYRIEVPEITVNPQTGDKTVRVEVYQGGITLCGDAGSLQS